MKKLKENIPFMLGWVVMFTIAMAINERFLSYSCSVHPPTIGSEKWNVIVNYKP